MGYSVSSISMQKIKDYQVVRHDTISGLEEMVKLNMEDNWVLTGGVSISKGQCYMQAMYKDLIEEKVWK